MACHDDPVTGSTLYRRLPDGTWASEREDHIGPEPRSVRSTPERVVGAPRSAAPVAGSAGSAGLDGLDQRSGSGLDGLDQRSAGSAGLDGARPKGLDGLDQASTYSARERRSSGAARSGSRRSAAGPRAAAAPPAAPSSPEQKSRWRRLPGPVRVVLIAVLAYAVWLVGLGTYAAMSLHKVDAMPEQQIANTSGRTWLLVGSDSREGLTPEEQKELTTGSEEGQRTDTIMLMHMSGLGSPTLVSIPRDSWVTIPAHLNSAGNQVAARSGKINAAYAFGGAPLLIETVEQNTGLHVDNYMEIGMGGIVGLTDAVGGIEACFAKPIDDVKSGLKVEAGCHTLDGVQSLAWVRMRYADPKGDLGRIERQQEYVSKVIHEAASWKTLVNPFRQVALVNAGLNAFVVDEGTGVFNLARLGLGMSRVAGGSADITTVPTSDTDHWAGGQWVLKWDTAKANELFASMGGTTPPVQSGG